MGNVPFSVAARYWLRLGCISFGGPAGQIALLHRELVHQRRWIDDATFGRALDFCMLLPGPEALQLAIYLGWRLHGTRGGVIAGLCFVLPAALLLLALSWVYLRYGEVAGVSSVLSGLKAVVVALIAQALVRLSRRALRGAVPVALAVGAFVGLHWLGTPFPLLLAFAAIVGAVALRGDAVAHGPGPGAAGDAANPARRERGAFAHLGAWLAIGLALWALPWLAIPALDAEFAAPLYLFFTQAALVTFGGAYAVLGYVNQQLVEVYGWLTPAHVVAGLALAETTPGPLVLVLQFYGFVTGWTQPGALGPLGGGVAGAVLASWATVLPSFVLILGAAPYVERLTANPRLAGALAVITAAVVGAIASHAVAVAV
ncbi:MAG: chromate efflux transporter, partial [Pseudomonadota bacterium]